MDVDGKIVRSEGKSEMIKNRKRWDRNQEAVIG